MAIWDFFKRKPQPEPVTASLASLVTLLADKPTFKNQNAFYQKLLTSKVGARLPSDYRSIVNGEQVVTSSNDQIGLPSTTMPDGTPMILVYCDIPQMVSLFPNDRFFELDGRVVLEMARSAKCGVIVQNQLDGKDSWAGVPREDVAPLLESLNRS